MLAGRMGANVCSSIAKAVQLTAPSSEAGAAASGATNAGAAGGKVESETDKGRDFPRFEISFKDSEAATAGLAFETDADGGIAEPTGDSLTPKLGRSCSAKNYRLGDTAKRKWLATA